ncbi:MAG: methylamine utilization protein [Pirellulaceae bacterium]|nr:methylamine utilization protein [Pirellulaceae bacterium]
MMTNTLIYRALAKLLAACIACCLLQASGPWAVGQDTATLRLKIVVDGQVPVAKKLDNINDAFCAENPIVSDALIVGPGGALKNFAVIFDEEKSKLKVPADMLKAPEASHVLDNVKCMFEPKVIVARSGQTISVKNSDNTGHNANFQFFNNPATNFLVPAGQSKDYVLKPNLIEPTAMPVVCNVHPWMKAFVIVKQHPYVGVTNEEGILEIGSLPVGSGAVFRLWHEASGAIAEIKVDGKTVKLTRGNRWELDLKPGLNDVGEIKLDAKLFKVE